MKSGLLTESKKLFNNNEYTPKRFGLKYNPPQIGTI